MSSERFALLVTVAALATGLALAGPIGGSAATTTIRSVDLSEAINRTVCPIEVDVDHDDNRVPKRIKIIKCASNVPHWCKAHDIQSQECCHHSHHGYELRCTQIRDTVLVYYKDSKTTTTYDVSVGCTCMIGPNTQAQEIRAR